MFRTLSILAFICLTFLVSSCEDKTQTDLYKAQLCVDNSTSATVNSCLEIIDGDSSEYAEVLRCSAAFIAEGITEAQIVTAIENIDGDDSNSDPTTPAIAALAMSSTTNSTAAVTTCAKTGSEILISLSNLSNLATAMAILLDYTAGAGTESLEAALAAYNSGSADATEKAALGAAIVSSQSSLCDAEEGQFKDDDICADINSSVAANPNDNGAIADALIAKLKE